jgi:hypothetical protein
LKHAFDSYSDPPHHFDWVVHDGPFKCVDSQKKRTVSELDRSRLTAAALASEGFDEVWFLCFAFNFSK